jgi:fatty-acyl-CoA synthase
VTDREGPSIESPHIPPEMSNVGAGSWIERRAKLSPGRPALISGDRSWTYEALAGRIRRLANGLRSLGIRRADRVGWVGANHPAFLEGFFAAGLMGATLVPVNHRLDPATIHRLLEEAEVSIVILEGSMGELSVPTPSSVVVEGAGTAPGRIDYETLLETATEEAIDESVAFDDLCMILFTSGTTGVQKGVMLSHGNVTWNVVNLLSWGDFRHDDVTIAIAPFFRAGGTGVNVFPVLFMGGTVIVPTSPDPDELLRLIERDRVTIGFANPDLLDAMARADLWGSVDLSSVRFIITGGAPVPERLIRTFLHRGVSLLQGYGLSEAGPVVLLLDPADALAKVGAAGKPPPLVDVRIVGAGSSDVPPGETGELLVRGPNVMVGYWKRPEETNATIDPNGWLRTGDAGRRDPDGDIWIVDRVADGYATPGGVVYPGDVERCLGSHPAVAEAGVVGLPGDQGAVGAAFVVVAEGAVVTEAELITHCRDNLAEHQVPASITFVDRLPRNSVGKLMRQALKGARPASPGSPSRT